MGKRMRDRTRLAIGLCVCVLAACLLGMIYYLRPALMGTTPIELSSDSFGMLLIDVLDQEAADSYHVDSFGVYVLAVQEQGQAESAGVSAGDRLTHVNAVPIHSTTQFMEIQEAFLPSERVMLDFQRDLDTQSYAVSLVWNDE